MDIKKLSSYDCDTFRQELTQYIYESNNPRTLYKIFYNDYDKKPMIDNKIAKINQSTDKKYVLKWSIIASVAGLGFNVIADPLVGYFYKQYILGQPQEMASVLAKWSTATTFVNAVVSTVLVGVVYNALRPVLIKSGILKIQKKD